MVSTAGSVGFQSYSYQQTLSNGSQEVKVRQEQVQPREAPAADSQKSDPRASNSKDEKAPVLEFTEKKEEAAPSKKSEPQTARGGVLDVTA